MEAKTEAPVKTSMEANVLPKEELKSDKHKLAKLNVIFGSLTEKNREILAVINKQCLPVVYSTDFYLSLALSPDKYCRLGTSPLTPYKHSLL